MGDDDLFNWKQLRKEVKEEPKLECRLDKIAKYFDEMQNHTRSIDFYTPNSWPTPWEILYSGEFCKSSISLLMYHTLMLACDKDVDMWLIDDGNDRYLVPILDHALIFNYHSGKSIDVDDIEITILEKFGRQIKTII